MADGDIPIEDALEDDSETVTIWAPEPSIGTDEVVPSSNWLPVSPTFYGVLRRISGYLTWQMNQN